MASSFVMSAVRARIDENITGRTVFYQNEAFEPPLDLSPFVLVEYPTGKSEQLTLGAVGERQHRDTGTIRFVVACVIGTPIADQAAIVEEFTALFRSLRFGADGATTLAAPFVETGPPSPPTAIGEDGGWYLVSASVPYFYDFMA